jgi:hypothetical protein
MRDVKEVYEMVTSDKRPAPESLQEQRLRQSRTARNRKIGAFVVAAIAAVVAAGVVTAIDGERPDTTVGTDVGPRAELLATRFMEAYADFDAERISTYLANDAEVSGFVNSIGSTDAGGTEGLRFAAEWLDAVGFEPIGESCVGASTILSGAVVRCTFDQHLLRSDEIGRGPFGPSYIDLTIRDGRIVRISPMFFDYQAGFSDQLWEPFIGWVTSTYPNDAATMYANDSHSVARLTEKSIRLWERHTRGYVEYVRTTRSG